MARASALGARLDRVARSDRFARPGQPPGCRLVGGHCNQYRTVVVEPGEAAPPDPTQATCPACGRPAFVRTYVVVKEWDDPPPLPPGVA